MTLTIWRALFSFILRSLRSNVTRNRRDIRRLTEVAGTLVVRADLEWRVDGDARFVEEAVGLGVAGLVTRPRASQ